MADTSSLTHWVRTLQDANVPLVQLQDPTVTRGPGILVVTDDQRIALWSAANREHERLTRGAWFESWWARVAITFTILSGVGGTIASIMTLLLHHP